jgi:cell division protein FtsA
LVPGTQALAQEILGLDVRIGYPEGISGGIKQDINNPMYATVMGLVSHAFSDIELQQERGEIIHQEQQNVKSQNERKTEKNLEPEEELNDKEHDKKWYSKIKNWFDQI